MRKGKGDPEKTPSESLALPETSLVPGVQFYLHGWQVGHTRTMIAHWRSSQTWVHVALPLIGCVTLGRFLFSLLFCKVRVITVIFKNASGLAEKSGQGGSSEMLSSPST